MHTSITLCVLHLHSAKILNYLTIFVTIYILDERNESGLYQYLYSYGFIDKLFAFKMTLIILAYVTQFSSFKIIENIYLKKLMEP